MEILDNQYTQDAGSEGLQVTRNMKINWLSTSKWAMFLAILGFIYVGFLLIAVAFMMPMMRTALSMTGQEELAGLIESAGIFFVLFMLLFAAVIFFIHLFHLRFSTGIKRALQYDDQDSFESAWRNLRNHFRLYGIVAIVTIATYIIALIFIGSMAASQPEF